VRIARNVTAEAELLFGRRAYFQVGDSPGKFLLGQSTHFAYVPWSITSELTYSDRTDIQLRCATQW
jgi:hypothetical protein